MHVSSLSSTVLMLGRSSGRCAQHSRMRASIALQLGGSAIGGRSPRQALRQASSPVIPSKERR